MFKVWQSVGMTGAACPREDQLQTRSEIEPVTRSCVFLCVTKHSGSLSPFENFALACPTKSKVPITEGNPACKSKH